MGVGPALAGWSPSRFVRRHRIDLLRDERWRTIRHRGRESGKGWRHANISSNEFGFGVALLFRLLDLARRQRRAMQHQLRHVARPAKDMKPRLGEVPTAQTRARRRTETPARR